MTTFVLSDELLNSSLSVRDWPIPSGVAAEIHASIASAAQRTTTRPLALRLRFGTLLLAAVGLLIVTGGSLYVASLKPPVALPTASPTMLPSATPSASPSPSSSATPSISNVPSVPAIAAPSSEAWTSYSSTKYLFSVNYPADWHTVLSGDYDPSPDEILGPGGLLSVSIANGAAPADWPTTPDAWLQYPCPLQMSSTTVGGYAAVEAIRDCDTPGRSTRSVRVVVNGFGYDIELHGVNEATADTILGSLVFLNQPNPPLAETFVSDQRNYVFDYPHGWAVHSDDQFDQLTGQSRDVWVARWPAATYGVTNVIDWAPVAASHGITPCTTSPSSTSEMSLDGHAAVISFFDCPSVLRYVQVRVIANGYGYVLEFQGDFSDDLVRSMIKSLRFIGTRFASPAWHYLLAIPEGWQLADSSCDPNGSCVPDVFTGHGMRVTATIVSTKPWYLHYPTGDVRKDCQDARTEGSMRLPAGLAQFIKTQQLGCPEPGVQSEDVWFVANGNIVDFHFTGALDDTAIKQFLNAITLD